MTQKIISPWCGIQGRICQNCILVGEPWLFMVVTCRMMKWITKHGTIWSKKTRPHTSAFISELQLFISTFVCYLNNWEYVYLQADNKYAHTHQRKKRIQYSYEFDITQEIVAFSKFYKLKLIYCYRTNNEVLSNSTFFFLISFFENFFLCVISLYLISQLSFTI